MTSYNTPNLYRLRLCDQVARMLLRAIVSGEIPAAAQLPTEQELCQRFGVSRSVIREALRVLATKGLVEIKHGRGMWVAPPSSWDPLDLEIMRASFEQGQLDETWWHFYEARIVVEVGTAELAAQRRQASDVEALRATLEQMRRAADDLDRYRSFDVDFHVQLVRAAHNPVLLRILEPVHTLLRAGGMSAPLISVQSALARHQAVLEAIERGDPDETRRAMASLFPRRGQVQTPAGPAAAQQAGAAAPDNPPGDAAAPADEIQSVSSGKAEKQRSNQQRSR